MAPRPIEIKVTSDTGSARSGLADVNSELGGLNRNATPGALSNLKKVGAALLAGGTLAKAAGWLKEAALSASDMNETVSKTQQVFGKNAGGVVKWAKDSRGALLDTEQAVLDVVVGFDLLLGNKGINGAAGRTMSKNLTDLSADLASFFNTDFESAAGALSSALRGEMDPIEAYGVSINAATLKAKAFELGLYSGKGALDATAQSRAAYALIMEQTAKAQGDVERTQGGLANQSRIFNANLAELKTTVGQSLVPLGEAILPKVNDALEDANAYLGSKGFKGLVEDIADAIDRWEPSLKGVKSALGKVDVEDIKEDFGFLEDAAGNIGDAMKTIWGAFQSLSPETKSNIATLVAAGAALKVLTLTNPVIKIGVNLAGEVVTSAAGAAASAVVGAMFNNINPLKVVVMNPGFDLETPDGKTRLTRALRGIDLLGTVIGVYEIAKIVEDYVSKPIATAFENDATLRRDFAALLGTYKVDKDRWNAGLDNAKGAKATAGATQSALELEIAARQRGDQKTRTELAELRKNYSSFVGAYYRRIGGGGGAYASSGDYESRALSSSALPLVTDEQIARAVYGTLMRSGVRNGTMVGGVL